MAQSKESVKKASTIMSYPLLLMALVILGEIFLGISPKADRPTWILENLPVFILIPVIVHLQPKLKLTHLTLTVLAFHALILMLGGHYTYAKVPIGFWVRDYFDFHRNNYDRLGHLMQGFGPALGLRELLLKRTILKRGWFTNVIILSMCLAFSAFYEIIEWWSALVMGAGADDFLGTQGDPWDTQWDMFCCLIGASVAIFAVGYWQDAQMRKNGSDPEAKGHSA